MLHLLESTPSIANRYVAEMRSLDVQNDRLRFRRNMERIGECIGFEISKTLDFQAHTVTTPLGESTTQIPGDEVVLATILRAGLPLHQGLLNVFDKAGNAFVSAYRRHHKDGTFEIAVEYLSCPSLDNKVLIISDPMLATGSSMVLATQALLRNGLPKSIHFVSAIAAQQGLDHLQRHFGQGHVWLGALDEELTAKSYIVPGLGDAGDLSYGAKLQE